ncbi:hd [Tieghemostelium lacteum]|uniref:Hd n=1 Tax=Tieghemostelium lacteum TaxID=361077 RepID=A0A151ZDM1_TIELA|nr:hd [Tieghemostelium lacteum]|eukprot:KYQ92058.1 hd [Tieghemostelium lacteum]
MDLIRALDVLLISPIDTEDQQLRKEKIEACRTISDQICAPSLRNTADFTRFLSLAIPLLLRAHGDKDLNVYSVAEESLNRTIKILIYSYHERILFELFKVLKGRQIPTTTIAGGQGSGNIATNDGMNPSAPNTPQRDNLINNITNQPPIPTTTSTTLSGSNSIFTHANLVLSRAFPLKSQRIALIKFGEVCSFIRPSKCRKYILSLVPPINTLLQITEDESLQESISISMEMISKVLIRYLTESEAHQLIELFMRNLSQKSAAVRRSASLSITSICRYYPKPLYEYTIETLYNFIQPPSNSTTIQESSELSNCKTLGVLFSYLQLIKLSEEQRKSDPKILDSFSIQIQFFVHFILKYIKLPNETTTAQEKTYDHNVVGLALDLLQQLLVAFGSYEYSWPKSLLQEVLSQLRLLCFNHQPNHSVRVSLKAVIINSLAQIVKYFPKLFYNEFYLVANPNINIQHPPIIPQQSSSSSNNNNNNINSINSSTGGLSTSFNGLSVGDINFKLFNHITGENPLNSSASSSSGGSKDLQSSSAHITSEPREEFLEYLVDQDPLLRGNSALLIGCLIRGFLESDHITSNQIYPSNVPLLQDNLSIPMLLVYLLRSLLDSSSVTAKLACTGIGECIQILSQSLYSEWSLISLRHLLCVSSSTYWLVKLEILETLSKIDYIVIEYLEQNIQQKSMVLSIYKQQPTQQPQQQDSNNNNSQEETGGAIAISIQSKVLDFLIEQLSDNDHRVRNSAGEALVNIIPRLVFATPLERHSVKGLANRVYQSFDVQGQDSVILRKKRVFANLSHCVGMLVNQLSNPHPDDKIRGCYHALNLLVKVYSFPIDTPEHTRLLSSSLANPMLAFLGDILPLALDRVGLSWVANDFDLHIDIIEILGYLSRGAENVLGNYCHNVLRHIVRIINISTNIIQFRPTPPLKEVKTSSSTSLVGSPISKSGGISSVNGISVSGGIGSSSSSSTNITSSSSGSSHLGAFTHSIHYIKLYAKLLATRTNSITTFGPDKFSQLRKVCFETLAVMLKCASKSVIPHCDELISYMTLHFEQEPNSVIKCLQELFLISMKPTPVVSLSGLSSSNAMKSGINTSSGNLKSQLVNLEPRSIEQQTSNSNPHDDQFLNQKSVYSGFLTISNPQLKQWYQYLGRPSSLDITNSFSCQEINRVVQNSEDKRSLFKQFEPLMVSSMLEYQTTHSLELKQSVLLMLSKFTKFGLDLTLFDKDQTFPSYLFEELKETQSLLNQPSQLLSYSYDFFGSLFIYRRLFSDNIHLDDLVNIFPLKDSGNSFSPSYSNVVIIENSHSFIRYLFEANDKYPETEFRDSFLSFLLNNLQFSQTVDALILLLDWIKTNNALYSKYSQQIANKFYQCLSMGDSPFFIINTIEDLEKLYTLTDRLHPQSILATRWADALLSASPEFIRNPPLTKQDPLQRKTRVLQLRESLLEAYDLRWLPTLLVLIRSGCKIPEEARISAARQSLFLSYHDNKSNPSPSANIISQLLIKMIRNAIQIFTTYKPRDPLFVSLINHLLYYSCLFFNKTLSTQYHSINNSMNSSLSHPLTISPSNNSNSSGYKIPLFLDSLHKVVDSANFIEISKLLFQFGGISSSIHAGRFLLLLTPPTVAIGAGSLSKKPVLDNEIWRSYAMSTHWNQTGCEHFLTHHCIFLLYCQALICWKIPITESLLSESFLDKVVLLINEPTIRKLVDHIIGNFQSLSALLMSHLKKICSKTSSSSYNLDQRKKQKLLRLLSYLPSNQETMELLITNFLQSDDISLQVSGERILNLSLNQLIDKNSQEKSFEIIQSLYKIFMQNFHKSTTNLQIESLFLKLIKNLSKDNQQIDNIKINEIKTEEITIENLIQSSSTPDEGPLNIIPIKYFTEIIKGQYEVDSENAFTNISNLSQISREATIELLSSPKLDVSLLPSFISSNLSVDYQEYLSEYLLKKIDTLLDQQSSTSTLQHQYSPISDQIWDELREVSRSLANYINRFGSAEFQESKLLRITTLTFIESFRRWKLEVINPYDFKLVLELSRSIILKSSSSILIITDDSAWCSLLLCLYKLYCLLIRPHFGYIPGQRELEENFSQDPTQVSLTQSNEMIKFLVCLLTNANSLKPTKGSHIGQLLFDSFIRSIIPLANKAFDFIYPTASNSADMDDEYGGGIIPNLPIFSGIVAPEQNMKALVKFIHYVDINDSVAFDQIWGILEPIFVCPLGDAEIGSDEISEESKCISLQGMVSMIIKVCFELTGVNSNVNLLETSTIPKSTHNHIPREKDLLFLHTNSGKKLNGLLSIIYDSLPQSEVPLNRNDQQNPFSFYTNSAGSSDSMPSSNDTVGGGFSSYHFNIERSFNNTSKSSFGCYQISLSDLRLFKPPMFIGINFTPILEKLLDSFESFLSSSMCPPLLKREILRSTLILSDLFNREQTQWMLRLFNSILQAEDIDDFLLKQSLIVGICKALAVLQPPIPIATEDPNHPTMIFEMLKQALEHPNISLQCSALDSVLYLLEAKINKYIQGPLLQYLFKWIPIKLTIQQPTTAPVNLTLRVLSTMFLLVEQYSREAEEISFTKRAVITCIHLGQQLSTPIPIVYGVFRGLDRLLVSFSLSHTQRELISHFSVRSLPLENPIRSMLALGLMITCIYTGDETGITSPQVQKSSTPSMSNSGNSLTAFSGSSPNGESSLSFSSDLVLEQELNDSFETLVYGANPNTPGLNPPKQRYQRINNMEKVKMLFDKIKQVSHYSYENIILSDVIPVIILDLFPSVDQILSFMLGEFLKQSKSNPKLICQILSNVFNLLLDVPDEQVKKSNQNLIYFWIIICLQNFFQIQNQSHCLWCLTFLFLTSSPNKLFKYLIPEFSSKIQSNEKLFLIVATEFFYNKNLSNENKKIFLDSFSKQTEEPYLSLMRICQLNK